MVRKKLFYVKTKRMSSYVVAYDYDGAKTMFEKWLNENDYGYTVDREVVEVSLVADTESRPNSDLYNSELLLLVA